MNTGEDTAANITLTGSDVDGDALSYTVLTLPAHGLLSGIAPNVVYTPDANFNGSDGFTFQVNDGQADSNIATVSIGRYVTAFQRLRPLWTELRLTRRRGERGGSSRHRIPSASALKACAPCPRGQSHQRPTHRVATLTRNARRR